MRIDRLDLTAYGPFSGTSLDLSQGNCGLHLICGRNEAGKSSTLRALIDGLFGIPPQTSDDFVHPYKDLRIGMQIRTSAGKTIAFVRRKAKSGALRDPLTDDPLPEGLLDALLGSVDRSLYGSMFGLTHEQLVSGGVQIAKLGNDIGQMLFSAAGSMADTRKVHAALNERADELFTKRGLKPRINAALTQHSALSKKLKEIKSASSLYQKLRDEIEALESSNLSHDDQTGQLRAEIRRLTRLQQAREPIAQRRLYLEQCAGLADAPRLPANFNTELQKTRQQLTQAMAQQEVLEQRRKKLEDEVAQQGTSDVPMAAFEPVKQLLVDRGAYLKAQHDLPGLRAKAESRQADAIRMLQQLKHAESLEHAVRAKLPKRSRDALSGLTIRFGELSGERLTLEQKGVIADRAIAAAMDELQAIPECVDASQLASTVERLQTLHDADQIADVAAAELQASEEEIAIAISRLSHWQGSAEQLESLAIPSSETLSQHDQTLREANDPIKQLGLEQKRLLESLKSNEIDLQNLRSEAGEIPTLEDLTQSRQRRDSMAEELRQTSTEERATSVLANTNSDRWAHFTEAMIESDRIADRMWQSAKQVAEQARLMLERERLNQRLAQVKEQQAAAQQHFDEMQARWIGLWQGIPIEVGTPREMLAWRAERDRLLDRMTPIRKSRVELQRLRDRAAQCRKELTAALLTVGERVEVDDHSAGLWQRARTKLDQLNELTSRRNKLHETLRERRRERQGIEDDRLKNLQNTLVWQTAWQEAVVPLGLSAEVSPDRAGQVLSERMEFEQRLDELFGAEGLLERISNIEGDAAAFAARAFGLASSIPGWAMEERLSDSASLEALLNELAQELKRVETAVDVRKRVQRELQDLLPKLQTAEETIAVCQAALQAAAATAGTSDQAELEERWTRSEQRRFAEERLRDTENSLASLIVGSSLDELEREVLEQTDERTGVDLPSRIAALEEKCGELEQLKQVNRENLGRLRKELDQIGGGSEAIDCRGELLQIEAELEADAREYCRVRAAAFVLGEAIERFQVRNQGPMLGAAGEMFQRLTCGSFEGLAIDHDSEGGTALVGRRAGTHVEIPIAGMSEGTADQLYLALRLAYLSQWLKHHEPLPLVVDDVLIKFDDARAAATLEVLAEFSRQTQVIMFTHHEHLLAIAQERLGRKDGEEPTIFQHRL